MTSNEKPPFEFDLGTQLAGARRKLNSRVGSVSINLPFLSFSLNPDDLEVRVARELVIRMADMRLLKASECCDNCIDDALDSLQRIRSTLVDKLVELSAMPDSPVYLLIEVKAEAIRQFLTFEQRINHAVENWEPPIGTPSDFRREPQARAQYFAALEMLRAHLYRCLLQMAKIGDISIPKISDHMQYDEAWQLEAYSKPVFLDDDTSA